jgi:hypothetical protein
MGRREAHSLKGSLRLDRETPDYKPAAAAPQTGRHDAAARGSVDRTVGDRPDALRRHGV